MSMASGGVILRTVLERCVSCGRKLAPQRLVKVKVMTSDGVVEMEDKKLRCVGKNCRVLYSNNYYRARGGAKINTSRSVGGFGSVILVTSSSGVCAAYIQQHYARIFRSSSNATSECAAMWRWICETGGSEKARMGSGK